MTAQFVTPSESCLCEKSFSRNAEQVCSPSLILLLLGGGRGIDTQAHGHSTYEVTNMGILLFATGVLPYTYICMYGCSTFTFLSNVLYIDAEWLGMVM